MAIPLRNDWQDHVKSNARVYNLSTKDREVIDKVFNRIHTQGRITWSDTPSLFAHKVFVVWKEHLDGKIKARPMVDLRDFNKLVVFDAYPITTQEEIIAHTF